MNNSETTMAVVGIHTVRGLKIHLGSLCFPWSDWKFQGNKILMR